MDETFIRTLTLPQWLKDKYFAEKEFYSIDELIGIIEDLDSEIDKIKDEFEQFKQDVETNYEQVSQANQIGWNSNW